MNEDDGGFPKIFTAILKNCDADDRWHWHYVKESDHSVYFPSCVYDMESITVYIPLEYRAMKNHQIRRVFEWVIDGIDNNAERRVPATLVRFLNSNEYLNARREIIKEELGGRSIKPPQEFNDAMALHTGLRKCLDGMSFYYTDTDADGTIAKSDYMSRTMIISREVFDHPDKLLRTYVVFRELASCLSVHPSSMKEKGRPNTVELKKYLMRFHNWRAYENKCRELGWKFRYPMEE